MAKRGPKRRTAAQTRKAASTRSRLSALTPPAKLTGAQRVAFRRLVGAIRAAGTADRVDVELVVATARTLVLLDQAHKELDGESLTLEAANGTAMPHPLLGVINAQTMRLRALLADLGLTPASAKLGGAATGDDQADEWSGILSVHAG
jgi:P27 family predicted phage terminase small subunit